MFGADSGDKVREPLFGVEVSEAGFTAILRLISCTLPLAWGYMSDNIHVGARCLSSTGGPDEITLGVLAAGLMLDGAMVMRKRASGD